MSLNTPRTYHIRTLGCQMNVHDSERMAGLLEAAGLVSIADYPPDPGSLSLPGDTGADVVVINTCSVRENAATRLFGNLGQLAAVKKQRPDMQIAVGGCLAQQLRQGIVEKAPWVDVVFGTHNINVLPILLERSRFNRQAAVEIAESLQVFPSTLPTKREASYAAWVAISVGCNNTCTFCIVPSLRGKERDRRPGEILAEVAAVVEQGAVEVTLLGQNVNSYGAGFGDRGAFAKLLRSCGQISGLERLRFTSPHPAAFSDDVIDAMAETSCVMPSLHMPLQSGSDEVLRAMRRSYRRDKFLRLVEKIRNRIPEAAITTDIIVGFPGETDADFAQTLEVMREVRFSAAFTFVYSPRPGTPAAAREDQIPQSVMSERYQQLIALQEEISWDENRRQIGKRVEILVTQGEGKKDAQTARITGRGPDARLIHAALPAGLSQVDMPRPGDFVTVEITGAAPHHLLADSGASGGRFELRRSRAGDLWQEARQCGSGTVMEGSSPAQPVALGIPRVGK